MFCFPTTKKTNKETQTEIVHESIINLHGVLSNQKKEKKSELDKTYHGRSKKMVKT